MYKRSKHYFKIKTCRNHLKNHNIFTTDKGNMETKQILSSTIDNNI